MKKIALHGIAILMALCLIISCDNSPKTKTFTVTFDSDGGTEVAAMTVEAGKTVTKPTAPEKSCWEFDKWTLDGADYDFAAPVEKDIELKANWKETVAVWDGKAIDTAWYTGHELEDSYSITKASELAGLAKLVNEKTSDFSGKIMKLMNDIDLNNKPWDPIGNAESNYKEDGKHAFLGTFDGNGKTIKNLKVEAKAATDGKDDYYASGLFGWTMDGSEIKGLTIDTAVVDGHHYVAAVVGYTFGKVTNCTVKNATLTNTHACTEGYGDKTGAILGILQGTVGKMSDCSATDCTITGSRDAGQLAGAIEKGKIENCKADDSVKVSRVKNDSCDDKYAGWNIQNDLYGRDLEIKDKDLGVKPSDESGT